MSKTLLPNDFRLTEEMRLWAKYKVPEVNVEAQFEMFCDYWRAHGKRMEDWMATWRNWMRRAPEFARPVNRYSNFERARPAPSDAIPPRKDVAPPMQPREHPLFRKN